MMATLTYDSINATTERRLIPALRDQIFAQNILLYRLLKGSRMGGAKDGGTQVLEPLEYGTHASYVGAYAAGAQLTHAVVETITAAAFDWKLYRGTCQIDGLEELENRGRQRVIDFIAAKFKNVSKSLAHDMATDLHSDGSGDVNGLVGLQALIDDGTNIGTYGGIVRSDYTWWKSYYADLSAGAYTLAEMRALITGVRVGNENPDLIVTTQAEVDAYEALLLGATPTFSLTQSTQMDELDGGFKAYKYKGIPIVWDSHVASRHMYAMNTKYMHFRVLQNFVPRGWVRPYDYDCLVNHVLWKGAFTGSGSRFQGQIRGS